MVSRSRSSELQPKGTFAMSVSINQGLYCTSALLSMGYLVPPIATESLQVAIPKQFRACHQPWQRSRERA
jgi:hypothetical protein